MPHLERNMTCARASMTTKKKKKRENNITTLPHACKESKQRIDNSLHGGTKKRRKTLASQAHHA